MKNQKGFSLIELLIVVVIIGIIAAIAIPNLLAARRSANEGSAVSSLRTVHGAQATYQATSGNGNYAGTDGSIDNSGYQQLYAVNLIDGVLGDSANSGGSQKSGFAFTMINFDFSTTVPNPASFAAMATPSSPSGITATGTRNFGIATDGVLGSEVLDPVTGTGTNGGMTLGGDAETGASYSAGTPMGNS